MSRFIVYDCGDLPDEELESLLDEFKLGSSLFECAICGKDFKKMWNGKGNRPGICGNECRRVAKNESQNALRAEQRKTQ